MWQLFIVQFDYTCYVDKKHKIYEWGSRINNPCEFSCLFCCCSFKVMGLLIIVVTRGPMSDNCSAFEPVLWRTAHGQGLGRVAVC